MVMPGEWRKTSFSLRSLHGSYDDGITQVDEYTLTNGDCAAPLPCRHTEPYLQPGGKALLVPDVHRLPPS